MPSYPFFSKQFGESLEHWTDSSVAVALKAKVDPTCLQSLVKLCRDRKLLFGEMFLAHHDHFHRRDHCSPHFTVGLGAGGRWALQMDTLCYTFSLERRWLYHTVNEFPSTTRWWHSQLMAWQFWMFFRPVSLHSGNQYLAERMVRLKTVWKHEFHVKYKICDNGAANISLTHICCSWPSQTPPGGPGMAACAASGGAVKQAESSGHVVAGPKF